jgi:hypothetical protein
MMATPIVSLLAISFVIVHFTLRREILLIEQKTGGVVDGKYILDAAILLDLFFWKTRLAFVWTSRV